MQLNTYRIECKRRMPIGACTLITKIVAPSYADALTELVEMYPGVDTMTASVTVGPYKQ